MAYTFIPSSVKDILDSPELQRRPKEQAELVHLFKYLMQLNKTITEPLSIDFTKPQTPKITRRHTLPYTQLSSQYKTLNIGNSVTPGEGSRGRRGAMNRGTLFEEQLYNDVYRWIEGVEIVNKANEKFIEEFVTYYKMTHLDRLVIIPEGALNKRRPIQVNGDSVTIGSSPNNNVGEIVTDITVVEETLRGARDIYLSLKYGPTVSFFNIGITKQFPANDFRGSTVSTREGKTILKLLGMDDDLFVASYQTGAARKKLPHGKIDVLSKISKGRLTAFLKSGIGWGYHLAHFYGNSIHHYEMTKTQLEQSCQIQSCEIEYGGARGESAVTAAFIETAKFNLTIKIRNKKGGTIPTAIVGDYKER